MAAGRKRLSGKSDGENSRLRQSYPRAIERRARPRFETRALLTMMEEGEISAFTRDISNIGVYFCVSLANIAKIGTDSEFCE